MRDHDVRRRRLEDLFESEPAAETAGAARARPQPRARDAEWKVHLHRLDRDVHAVRDIGLDDVDAVLVRTRAHTARGELTGDEWTSRLRIAAAERHHEQRAGVRRGHPAR